jgi:RNA polymerase subunit RPABC4/transcription elongation factor Spt4
VSEPRSHPTQACPECGRSVDPTTEQFCPNCGYPIILDRGDEQKVPPPVTRSPGESQVSPPAAVSAGSSVEGAAAREAAQTRACPQCGHISDPARVRCEVCGSAIGVVSVLLDLPPAPPSTPQRRARDPWPLLIICLAVLAVALVVASLVPLPGSDSVPRSSGSGAIGKVPHADVRAQASSTLPDAGALTYDACNTLDNNRRTAWNSAHGTGAGQTLTFTFARPVDLRTITVVNGYAKSPAVFRANSSIREATVTTETTVKSWALQDTRAPQTFTENFGITKKVTIRVDAVRLGNRYGEVAVSEVWFGERSVAHPSRSSTLDVSCPPA